ncbi:MAG: J domain-containing protein [Burkholderiales bacterium]|nr:J domain-containing protein [Burkholderiales bacterium]
MSRTDALQISSASAGPPLTPAQKRFNTLIRQIEQARQTLAAWHDGIGAYREAHVQVLQPLQTELAAARRQWVLALDGLLDQRGWAKAERATLAELVCDLASELLDANDDDAELRAVFAKHAEVDFDTERRQVMRAMKDMTQAMTGLDLGDDEGLHTEEDLFARMRQGLRERAAADAAEREARAPRHRKSAAQQRREAEAQQATQSVREIFRKLASALHPDRETDAAQREAKTALMQQVNQAYAASDLLTLLELQLRIEQIDAGHIAGASAQRLKHYNKVLSDQLAELKAEVGRVEMGFQVDFGLQAGWGLNPRKLGQLLKEASRELRAELEQRRHELRMLTDVSATKRWLKRQRQLMRDAEFGSDLF